MHSDSLPFPCPPRVPDDTVIYAIGDVHGRLDLLERLIARIEADVVRVDARRRVVVFLGDYVDRGPDSRGVIDRLSAGPPASGPLAGAEWICLKGNHEEYLVRFLTEAAGSRAWLLNGGLPTVQSYVGASAGALPEGVVNDMAGLQMVLSRAVPPAHLRWMARLPVRHVEGDYLFVHAGIRPGTALDDQDPADLLWIRDDFLSASTPFEKVVVHGHSTTALPEIRSNRIGIDTGAYRSGRLTALVLEGADKRFLAT